MKLIATRDIHRVGPLTELEIEGASATMIPKGSALEIGKADTLQAMRKPEPANATLVAQLFHARCVCAASDADAVKAVRDEVASDRRREQNAAKRDAVSQNAEIGERVIAQLEKAAK